MFLANESVAEVAASRYRKLSAEYQRVRKEIARLKLEASKLKKDMRRVEDEAEDRLVRDDQMELEQIVASCLSGRDSIVVPSGLEMDLSEAYFPELGGGPTSYWHGDFVDDVPDVASANIPVADSYSS